MRRIVVVPGACLLLASAPGWAQVPTPTPVIPKSEVATESVWQAGLERGAWQLTLQLGSVGLAHTLLKADRILVDYENEAKSAIYANMSLDGKSSFSPQVKLGYTFSSFCIEEALGFGIGDYQQNVDPSTFYYVDPARANTLTETEIKTGSYFLWLHETELSWFPVTHGHLLPFLTGGVGGQYWFLDSPNYVEGTTSSFAYSIGAGLRIVGDDLFSIRFEARNYWYDVNFTPSPSFLTDVASADNTLVDIPLEQLDAQDRAVPVEQYEQLSFSNFWMSLGFTASF